MKLGHYGTCKHSKPKGIKDIKTSPSGNRVFVVVYFLVDVKFILANCRDVIGQRAEIEVGGA